MRESQDGVLLLLQRLLDLLHCRAAANRRANLVDLGAVRLEAVGEAVRHKRSGSTSINHHKQHRYARVAEVACVQNEGLLVALNHCERGKRH